MYDGMPSSSVLITTLLADVSGCLCLHVPLLLLSRVLHIIQDKDYLLLQRCSAANLFGLTMAHRCRWFALRVGDVPGYMHAQLR
jgi:hypothetical protein